MNKYRIQRFIEKMEQLRIDGHDIETVVLTEQVSYDLTLCATKTLYDKKTVNLEDTTVAANVAREAISQQGNVKVILIDGEERRAFYVTADGKEHAV